MRRKEKEITEKALMEEILHKALVCHLAMSDAGQPYVIPLNFAYRDHALYIHCAQEGTKLDILRRNHRVCFEVDVEHELVKGKAACEWGMKGKSVIGFGKATLIADAEGKRKALDIIMEHYGAEGPFDYKEKSFEKALVIKIDIERMTGRKTG